MGNSDKRNINISDILLFIIFLLLLALPGYLCYQLLVSQPQKQEIQTNTEEKKTAEETNPTEEVKKEEEKPQTGPHYTEIVRELEGQTAYIAVPTDIDTTNPPEIVVYNHGSNTRVISDMYDPFMRDLQVYGDLFTTKNFIFAASNAHGENWGNAESIADNLNMITWIRNRYPTAKNLYFIGFSMGGLPTTHYVTKYPDDVVKIALLAPTTRTYEWNATEVAKIKDIDIKIWHGVMDVNIEIQSSREFVTYMKKLGKDIPLVELQAKTHSDLDTEYKEDVLNFFLAQ